MQYLHFGPFRKYACGVQASLYEDPTLNAIPTFWAISKVRMWGLNIFIRKSYLKCNTCILGHTKNTHVGSKPSLNEDPTLNVIPTFWVTPK